MKWNSVHLIWMRELRDQLRDPRTLFMIGILPLLLYPLLGVAFLQMVQFLRRAPLKVYLVGAEQLPENPSLFGLDDRPGTDPSTRGPQFETKMLPRDTGWIERTESSARMLLESGEADAVVYFPPDFGRRLRHFQNSLTQSFEMKSANLENEIPEPAVYYSTAKDKSRMANDRLTARFRLWRQRVVEDTLASHDLPVDATRPFEWSNNDLSEPVGRRAVMWSKILPFVALIWALTGAFYPAIDLCAGEKERGTLETLLSSPAERSEIVAGKLLTVMVFSIATSLLNLGSMGITAAFIGSQFQNSSGPESLFTIGAPPWFAVAWLVAALVPISALFSAASLALAAMAKSTREGQYYLMPLMLITMPLLLLPMFPSAGLDLGTSLIPLTGVVLLLRSLIEGEYGLAMLYFVPVTLVTTACCFFAIRWAIGQFKSESVLFRESERLQLRLWLRHVIHNRGDVPTATQAVLCGVLLLVIRFFASFLLPMPQDWNQFVVITAATMIVFFAVPALLMTLLLTRSPHKTLLLGRPSFTSLLAAFFLALFLHPIGLAMHQVIQIIYPANEAMMEQFKSILGMAPSVWHLLPVLALAPAICEELAYRGFILSGLRQAGSNWKAVVTTSVFFGVAHGVIQQSLNATLLGLVIGLIAVRSGSIWPCIVFHFTHNASVILAPHFFGDSSDTFPLYGWHILLISVAGAVWLIRWFVVHSASDNRPPNSFDGAEPRTANYPSTP